MLIRSIRAENFMKFHRLHLEDLPARGVIGIEGQNEGGKSTIGELVQFALFGKSVSSAKTSILEVINWDRDQCAVELDFELPTGDHAGTYRIWREIDRYGTNFARLTKEAGEDWTEIASGLTQVQAQLATLMRFDFDDFLRSFFLNEKEFPRSPEAMRQFLDRMVGADVLVSVAESVRREIQEHEGEFSKQQAEIKRNQQQVDKYLPNIEKIPAVEAQRDEHDAAIEEYRDTATKLQAEESEIETALKAREAQRDRLRSLPQKPVVRLKDGVKHLLEGYPNKAEGVLSSSSKDVAKVRSKLQEFERLGERFDAVVRGQEDSLKLVQERINGTGEGSLSARQAASRALHTRATQSRSKSVVMGTLLFFVGVAIAVVGFALMQEAFTLPSTWQISSSAATFGCLGGGALFVLLAIILWTRATRHRLAIESCAREETALEAERVVETKKLETLQQFGRDSARMDEVVSSLEGIDEELLRRPLGEYSEQLGKITVEGSLEKACTELSDDESRMIQRLRTSAKNASKELQKTLELQKKEVSRRDRAETEIREYEKQEGRKSALEEQNGELKVGSDAIRTEIETRQLLLQLLDETVESIRHRAGPGLGKAMRRLLPALTGGRYRDLKITPEFKLQVFTSEKSDFLSQHELSGGTFEGLSLGFRLAFSQAFIRAVVRGPQFLFLDEPFKAMDSDRVHLTLSALMQLSPDFQQIFVIIPGIRDADRSLFDVIHQVSVGDPLLGDGERDLAHPPRRLVDGVTDSRGSVEGNGVEHSVSPDAVQADEEPADTVPADTVPADDDGTSFLVMPGSETHGAGEGSTPPFADVPTDEADSLLDDLEELTAKALESEVIELPDARRLTDPTDIFATPPELDDGESA